MRFRQLKLKNYRGYKQETAINFKDFTAVVGMNDAGKSTLLEALDVFFNDKKLDISDKNVNSVDTEIRISCSFDELPKEIVIDASARTSLDREYLLNARGLLEIVKIYDVAKSKISPEIFANATHPTAQSVDDLLYLKHKQLGQRCRELGIDIDSIDQRKSFELRQKIWAETSNLQLKEVLINLNQEDAKAVWARISEELPIYALFQADRPSKDDDEEISDPMDIAVKMAVHEVEAELDKIRTHVMLRAKEVAARTLDKLQGLDATLASELIPEFKSQPKWSSFKMTISDHNNIPINKRGSGVRRLVLLSFFRAEAERRQEERSSPGIFYAIEEPESSQHPKNQRLLIEALLDVVASGSAQVAITTHVPGIASLIEPSDIRYIGKSDAGPVVRDYTEQIAEAVSRELGILPDNRVKILIHVEGPNDVSWLEHMSKLCGIIDLQNDPRVAFVVLGGGNLKHWVNKRYLKGLEKREVHIYDRDNDGKYQVEVDEINGRGNGDWAVLTGKREAENYLHPDTILRLFSHKLSYGDEDDVPVMLAQAVYEELGGGRMWANLSDEKRKKRVSSIKRKLNTDAAREMTVEELRQWDSKGEIEGWMKRIKETLDLG